MAEEYLHVMEKIRDELKEETKDIKGSEVSLFNACAIHNAVPFV